jgi:hypothetical protein
LTIPEPPRAGSGPQPAFTEEEPEGAGAVPVERFFAAGTNVAAAAAAVATFDDVKDAGAAVNVEN